VSGRPRLEVNRVTFGYGASPVVTDVSLALWPGRFVGLLGPNGSGKSTLLRLAAGLLRPRQGTVRLDGRNLGSFSRAEIARQVAVVPQQPLMPEALTGWDVALAGRTPHLRVLRGTSPLDDAIVRRALALVDATHLADRRVGEISGGERQRLLLARALAQEPTVLLLDEPTAHLDLPHQLTMLDLSLRFARDADLAILGVFHDLNLAAAYCDELSLMREGQIMVHGTPDSVISEEWIATVYGLDTSVVPHPQSGRPVVLLPPARPCSETDDALATSDLRDVEQTPCATGWTESEEAWAR
jgi:iron complex transport system ATP-binding protein